MRNLREAQRDMICRQCPAGVPEGEATESRSPVAGEFIPRRPLYHLNLFGEGYGGSVDRVLAQYVGLDHPESGSDTQRRAAWLEIANSTG
jgi:hypothetical protein